MKDKHPTFKPIFVGHHIFTQPHMLIPAINKMIPAKESWAPCFDEIVDQNGEFVSGNVEVRLIPWWKGVIYQGKSNIEKWCWRITIWGSDDTMVAKIIDSKEDALATYEALDLCPSWRTLVSLWGFIND